MQMQKINHRKSVILDKTGRGKVIHLEMSKKYKFDHMNKWYMHNQVSVLENNTHKLLWDFDTQTDHLISARRLDLIIINNIKKKKKKKKGRENFQNCGLCCPGLTTE